MRNASHTFQNSDNHRREGITPLSRPAFSNKNSEFSVTFSKTLVSVQFQVDINRLLARHYFFLGQANHFNAAKKRMMILISTSISSLCERTKRTTECLQLPFPVCQKGRKEPRTVCNSPSKDSLQNPSHQRPTLGSITLLDSQWKTLGHIPCRTARLMWTTRNYRLVSKGCQFLMAPCTHPVSDRLLEAGPA